IAIYSKHPPSIKSAGIGALVSVQGSVSKRFGRSSLSSLTTLDLSAKNAAALPARIGKYEVKEEIGEGDLIRLVRAFDCDTGRPVTLKILTDKATPNLVDRFRREVGSAAKLRTPNTIAIYEMGEHAGLVFAAMQWLGDDSLHRAIRTQRPLTLLQKT